MTQQLPAIIISLASCWLPATVSAISLSQSVDHTEMAFEETAQFEISITWAGPPGIYRFDRPLRLEVDKLKVTRFSSSITSTGVGDEEVTTKLFEYTLTPTASGQGTIQSLSVEYGVWPDTLTGLLVTDPVQITIAEPLLVSSSESDKLSTGFVVAVILIIVTALGGAIYWGRRRKPRKIAKTPVQAFLDELTALKQSAGSDMKTFQTGLYKNLIRYLSEEYKLDLNGKSLEQVISELEQTDMSRAGKDSIAGWLTRAEKEKFSPLAATPGETIRLESEIRQFLKRI